MPWKEETPMVQRCRFIFEYESGIKPMAQLCRCYGISRKTGYKWLKRYRKQGLEGLRDRPRRPGPIPHKTPAEVERLLVEERKRHPHWGPKKLVVLLKNNHQVKPPAPSTAGDILKRHGLIKPRGRIRNGMVRAWPGHLVKPKRANESWAADFKGWFRTRDRRQCHSLTISDLHNCYILCCQALKKPDYDSVSRVFVRLFRQVGLPERIRVDNGAPFGSRAAAGLSRLSVIWLKLGIEVEYIQPGHPEHNARHERMHRTLKDETTQPPAANLGQQQKRFDLWRKEFNQIRPHEALGQVPPATLWKPPSRKLRGPIPDFQYPNHWEKRRVRKDGMIRWRARTVYVGQPFAASTIGLQYVSHSNWLVYAGPVCLGVINNDRKDELLRPPVPTDR